MFEKLRRFNVLLVLLLVGETYGGLWITLPSAQAGCGSLQSNFYFWDTFNVNGYTYNQPYPYYDFSVVPKGDYYFYYNPSSSPGAYSDVRQYFCTGYVDSMPVGSYCFYQNRQNCNSFSFIFQKIISF